MEHVTHENIPPFFDKNSQILILGSMPSKKSREAQFYYMHPQNRFWKILSIIFEEEIEDKKEFLTRHHIALWDTIASCDIKGASDASIKNVIPNDISKILKNANIKMIFTAGKTAEKYYQKYTAPKIQCETICLPSTSPANCQITLKEIVVKWAIIKDYLEDEKT